MYYFSPQNDNWYQFLKYKINSLLYDYYIIFTWLHVTFEINLVKIFVHLSIYLFNLFIIKWCLVSQSVINNHFTCSLRKWMWKSYYRILYWVQWHFCFTYSSTSYTVVQFVHSVFLSWISEITITSGCCCCCCCF